MSEKGQIPFFVFGKQCNVLILHSILSLSQLQTNMEGRGESGRDKEQSEAEESGHQQNARNVIGE